MKLSAASKYALRSLARNSRRTVLSVLGVGIAVAVSLISIAFIRGEGEMYTRAAAESGAGHLKIVPVGWKKTRDIELRLTDWRNELDAARAMPEVKVATPRARTDGLLAMGNRIAAVEVVGVDPTTEQQALRFVRNIAEGRYLRPDDDNVVVIGRAIADRLDSTIEDLLVITVVGRDGDMENAMLEIVGIVETGNRDIDGMICHVNLPVVEKLTGLAGASEISILLHDQHRLDEIGAAMSTTVPAEDEVLTWAEVSPEMRMALDQDEGFANLTIFIIILVVLLGVTSAQLAAVLERRREFAVLTALGMKTSKVARIIVSEALVLGLAGALVGLLLGTPSVYYLATTGLDIGSMLDDQSFQVAGIILEPIMYADIGWWLVPQGIALSLGATILASIYPAWFAARTDPADALRVAQ